MFLSHFEWNGASKRISAYLCSWLLLAGATIVEGQDDFYPRDPGMRDVRRTGSGYSRDGRSRPAAPRQDRAPQHHRLSSQSKFTDRQPSFGYQPKHERISDGRHSAELQAARHRATMARQTRLMAHEAPEPVPHAAEEFNGEHPVFEHSCDDTISEGGRYGDGGYFEGGGCDGGDCDGGDCEGCFGEEVYYDEGGGCEGCFGEEVYYDEGGGCEGCFGEEVYYDEDGGCEGCFGEEVYYDEGGGCSCGSCTGCGSGCGGSRLSYMLQNMTLFSGVHGFTGPSNLSSSGSFGFHEGLNIGMPMPLFHQYGFGMQAGFRTLQSNLSGSGVTNHQRNQSFFTTGIFRRSDWGLQGGVVFDLLRDRWYDAVDVSQVRGEISWKHGCQSEFGYWFASGDKSDDSVLPNQETIVTQIWEATELHAFFYRRQLACLRGGLGRFYAGFTGNHDGLIGADTSIPFNSRWSLDSYFTYLIPDEPTGNGGIENEAWNIGLSLVFHLGGKACCDCGNFFEPLLGVADNGVFIVDRVPTSNNNQVVNQAANNLIFAPGG